MWRQKKFDLIVVGGGPAGTTAARYAAKAGISVLVLEKDRDIGVPVRCGEAVSDEGLRLFVKPDPRWINSVITKLRLISPNDHKIDLNLKQKGYILDRRIFDYDLAQYASASGAQIVCKAYVNGLLFDDSKVVGVTGEYQGEPFEVKSKLVIGADGVESRIGRWAGLDTVVKMKDMESAAQKTISGIEIDEHRFDFYMSHERAPGGYLWIFPKGSNAANVGLGVSGKYSRFRSAQSYLDDFLQKTFPNGSVVSSTVGGVPCDKTLKKFVSDGLMLAGDAAHMVNPMTGGGIIPGMRGGMLAGETAVEAIKAEDTSEKFLNRYSKEWNKVGGKNHERFYSIKETVSKLTDEELNSISDAVEKIPPDDRTIGKVFRKAIFKKPSLLVDVMKVFAGV
ncbi:MAG: NAD(P)/FAD-dependent oxidoreductase [Candidatus Marinimicrobia bacterium]|jgi:digeranylgeranylglycerophospholipid reductase|nr:NAD(P)/FAD-dependent oxidoreductase [Candidatus Neomarinimicrobiota bacterium]MDP6578195.1 NAD(P)/FAD-dependent oxidoreductase [Candidatus Neomarinimicrobiota bacterium]MDP7061003.1 NAD(P)/FAD-dependent oxidoreductase [Candidatus Neomarinimicrobiota bacterium]|tara:strand:- start:905 stop:2086 length:1182 start_codon:yes stop_codon:yes gene_type:complete